MTGSTRITYIVHDLNEAAVARRVRMLRAGGAEVTVAGFHREAKIPADIVGSPVIALGRTGDAKLVQRAGQVVTNLLRPGPLLRATAGADIIMARNLECLALAARAHRRERGARLVYECLDIHRLLVGHSRPARVIQAIEAYLLRGIDLLIVSSPAFLRQYFARRSSLRAPTLLVENKLLVLGGAGTPPVPPAPPRPWTIGWFGNLRCRRTFDVLTTVARLAQGNIQILIAGRPSTAEFADFASMVAAAPHCRFLGGFTANDLPHLYAQCHFAWAIDFFEEGLNSTWLLPNRLYEASSFGAVPIALQSVETGRWLARHGCGLLLDDGDPVPQLGHLIDALDADAYATLRARVASIPRADLIADDDDCVSLVAALTGREATR